jgi:hypothetical protein
VRLALATICLNEMEWLPRSIAQHSSWPGLVGWVVVEGADVTYARVNPSLVRDGLSVDGTTEFLQTAPVTYIQHGLFGHHDPAQAKCVIRNRYMEAMEQIRPTHVLVLDADEFYSHADQAKLSTALRIHSRHRAFTFKQRHICRDFGWELMGGYWAVPHTRGWRWESGARYVRNHNFLESNGAYLTDKLLRLDRLGRGPTCVHMGYASSVQLRTAKHRYYEVRGEAKTREMYVNCRRAWELGAPLPHGARIARYTGPIPECFDAAGRDDKLAKAGQPPPHPPRNTFAGGLDGRGRQLRRRGDLRS